MSLYYRLGEYLADVELDTLEESCPFYESLTVQQMKELAWAAVPAMGKLLSDRGE